MYVLVWRYTNKYIELGQRCGTHWTGHQSITGSTYRHKPPFILTHVETNYNQPAFLSTKGETRSYLEKNCATLS